MREGQPIVEISIPRSMVTSSGAITSSTAIPSLPSSPLTTAPTSPVSAPTDTSRVDSMDELSKRMAELSLSLQTIFQNWPIANGQGSSVSGPPRSQNLRPSSSTRHGPFKCIWCDSTEHIRRDCAELTAALNAGQCCQFFIR